MSIKVLMLAVGSRGDVQPFVALGVGLQAAGHDVTICASESFQSLIEEHGLTYAYMNNRIIDLANSDTGSSAMEDGSNIIDTLKVSMKLLGEVRPIYEDTLQEEWDAAQALSPDIILHHPKAIGGQSIAQKLGIPAIVVQPVPILGPTTEFPSVVFPRFSLGGWYNKLSHQLTALGTRMMIQGIHNDWRQETLDLPSRSRWQSDVYSEGNADPLPVFHCVSQHVIPKPHDWADNWHVTGYWFLDQRDEWQPSPELQAFLDAGARPVYVGFGSISGRDPQQTTQMIIDALQQVGERGILATGWGGLQADSVPEDIFVLDSAPHDWLFPRMKAVVHHGGAGTTAAGLRAGKPTLICPFFADQPFWGHRVAELGVGAEPIPQKQLTVEKLTDAIRTIATDATMQQRAADLGQRIRNENGVQTAMQLVEQYAQQRTPSAVVI